MELATITEVISTLGFPIACVLAMGFFIYKIYKKSEDRENKLLLEIAENRKINAKAVETITLYADRLTHIETDITTIKDDLIVIKENIDK